MVRTSIGALAALWLVIGAAACAGPAQSTAAGQSAPMAQSTAAGQSAPMAQSTAARQSAPMAQSTAAVAPNKGTAQSGNLRIEWEFDSARGEYRNACGRVLNDRDVPARRVMLTFDGYDGEGKKVSSRSGQVVGDVPPRGYAIFCLQVKTGATSYQVSVPGVDWGYSGGGQ